MKLLEYRAKELLKKKGISVPNGVLVEDATQLDAALSGLKGPPWVVKAQVHAGGRGKAGGIVVAEDKKAVIDAVERLLHRPLVTAQTGEKGVIVRHILLEEHTPHTLECYVGITLDRANACPTLLFSPMGGMEIEDVARRYPKAVSKVKIDPLLGFRPYKARDALFGVEPILPMELHPGIERLFGVLYETFMEYDCSLLEINPLSVTEKGQPIALDAKMALDENALFRHKEISEEDPDKDPLEAEAQKYGLSYIRMEGDVGVMVNGAGLAMATMDIIKLAGREPANFLDVGGGASQTMVEKGFEIILKDPNVKMVLVNIFGGILRCDVLARGMVEALGKVDLKIPLVVRLEGTNVNEGREILKGSGIRFSVAQNLEDAVRLIREAGDEL